MMKTGTSSYMGMTRGRMLPGFVYGRWNDEDLSLFQPIRRPPKRPRPGSAAAQGDKGAAGGDL